jgi:hypothetical protein
MSKEEQFEHIENKIKEAIQNHRPAFDEKAWDKMEALLDKDEKDRKPFYWMWFLCLLLGGAATTYFFYHHKNTLKNAEKNIAHSSSSKNILPISEKPAPLNEANTVKNSVPLPSANNADSSIGTALNKEKEAVSANEVPQKDIRTKSTSSRGKSIKVTTQNAGPVVVEENPGNILNKHLNNKKRPSTLVKNGKVRTEIESGDTGAIANSEETTTDKTEKEEDKKAIPDVKEAITDTIALVTAKDENKKSDSSNTGQNKKKSATKNQQKSSKFYLLGSLGADVGSVKLFSFSNSSFTAKYGIGAGYQLNKKWSLQTGFYAAKKKYAAGPGDYHVKADSYWSYYTITKVNAECMVYEVPVTVRYNFLQKQSVSYYTTLGVSSYLMKKEDYNYKYLRYNMPAEKDLTYTGNKHLFSTLSISAGVEKKLSDKLFLQIEPSVSLPLSGVGDGKVKLYSTAVMLGIKYLPFKARK